MIYITGDAHGEQSRFVELNMPGENTWTEDDVLIVCGDFGYLFLNNYAENKFLDDLSFRPYTIAFVDGNHENFPAIYSYPEEEWCGGKIHRIRKNIIHLMRGQVFEIQGKKIFTMGGAYSIDKYMRQEGYSWWKEELPTDAEYKIASENLAKHNFEVDYILSHTAPTEIIRMMGKFPDAHDMELTGYLEWVMHETKFKKWFFGHWHIDKDITDKVRALMFDVVQI